jgi:hypothetical protein
LKIERPIRRHLPIKIKQNGCSFYAEEKLALPLGIGEIYYVEYEGKAVGDGFKFVSIWRFTDSEIEIPGKFTELEVARMRLRYFRPTKWTGCDSDLAAKWKPDNGYLIMVDKNDSK